MKLPIIIAAFLAVAAPAEARKATICKDAPYATKCKAQKWDYPSKLEEWRCSERYADQYIVEIIKWATKAYEVRISGEIHFDDQAVNLKFTDDNKVVLNGKSCQGVPRTIPKWETPPHNR